MIGGLLAPLAGSACAHMALRYSFTALAILLFQLALRHSGAQAGRLAERRQTMEKTHNARRRMLEAVARRPRSREHLVERPRNGRF